MFYACCSGNQPTCHSVAICLSMGPVPPSFPFLACAPVNEWSITKDAATEATCGRGIGPRLQVRPLQGFVRREVSIELTSDCPECKRKEAETQGSLLLVAFVIKNEKKNSHKTLHSQICVRPRTAFEDMFVYSRKDRVVRCTRTLSFFDTRLVVLRGCIALQGDPGDFGIWLNAPPWIWCGELSSLIIKSLKGYTCFSCKREPCNNPCTSVCLHTSRDQQLLAAVLDRSW